MIDVCFLLLFFSYIELKYVKSFKIGCSVAIIHFEHAFKSGRFILRCFCNWMILNMLLSHPKVDVVYNPFLENQQCTSGPL